MRQQKEFWCQKFTPAPQLVLAEYVQKYIFKNTEPEAQKKEFHAYPDTQHRTLYNIINLILFAINRFSKLLTQYKGIETGGRWP